MQANLKYEIYGILLIIFSVITLAGKSGSETIAGMGSVGHAFNYIFYFFSGRFYFVFPLIGIYVGLFVMMNRAWPKQWTLRKTGLLLILFGFLIFSHMELYEKLNPPDGRSLMGTIRWPFDNLSQLLSGSITVPAFYAGLGGGFIGAVLYGTLHFLLDDLGARLIMITCWVIGFTCVTGLSLVDAAARIRKRLKKDGKAAKTRFSDMLKLLSSKRSAQRAVNRTAKKDRVPDLPVEEEFNEENYKPEPAPRKTLKWFQWFADRNDASSEETDSSGNDFGEEPYGETDEMEEEEHDVIIGGGSLYGASEEEIPHIRDFQDSDTSTSPSLEPHVYDDGPFETEMEQYDTDDESSASENDDLLAHHAPAASQPVVKVNGSSLPDESTDGSTGQSTPSPAPPNPYILPPLRLLSKPAHGGRAGDANDHRANARKLEATLESFGVRAKVLEVVRGPAVTRYEIQPDIGVKVSRIVSLTDDIALALAAKDIRMEAPIPGKSAIGIEVPNTEVSIVTMREVMETPIFTESEAKLSIALGRDISGQPIVANLAKMPHLLVAGATGSGKSVCINGIIVSVLYKAKPDEVKFLMIDPKMVELNVYNGIPHLLAPVVTDPRRASLALKQVVKEMEKRYEMFSKSGTRNIEGYNSLVLRNGTDSPLPYIVVIVDELADLMMVAAGDVEDSIARLAQMARAAGIHLIIATQRPSVDVITGVIKANIPSRIAFGVSSQVDSRTILDAAGAEKLLGRGDMLFVPVGASKAVRIQGAFLSDQEVEAVVHYVSDQEQAEYVEDIVPEVSDAAEEQDVFEDELYDQAVQIILEAKQASVSLLQRRLRIGYTRAARLIDSMEARGVVGPYEGSKPREVLITHDQYMQNRSGA